MLLLILFMSILSGFFFYWQAMISGLGVKRWSVAGVLFGPLIWPMFTMNNRMNKYKKLGISRLTLNA